MTMMWVLLAPRVTAETLGFIPSFLDEDDPRPAAEQFNERYIGGWHPFDGFKRLPDGSLKYPGDPPLKALAMTTLQDEAIVFYQYSWVVILQKDGTWEVARMD